MNEIKNKDFRLTPHYSRNPKGNLSFSLLFPLFKNCMHKEIWACIDTLPKKTTWTTKGTGKIWSNVKDRVGGSYASQRLMPKGIVSLNRVHELRGNTNLLVLILFTVLSNNRILKGMAPNVRLLVYRVTAGKNTIKIYLKSSMRSFAKETDDKVNQ